MRRPTFQRSAALAPPWPSKMMRLRDILTKPPVKPLPFHCGKVLVPVTAIACVYTSSSGFAIGADGRGRWDDPTTVTEARKRMESDEEQKIFEAAAKRATIGF